VTANEVFDIQRQRADRRHMVEVELAKDGTQGDGVCLRSPLEIADRLATQFGCSVEEAIDRWDAFDRLAVLDFHVGNSIPKENLH